MRTAIVGMGVIGQVHAEVLKELGKTPVAVCDVIKERCNNTYGALAYADYDKMLQEVKPDVVHICTPHYLHAPMVIKALQQNIHVLCEKPLCIHQTEIASILTAQKNSKAQLGVCLQNRYNGASQFVKEYLKTHRALSGIGMVAWHRDAAYYHSGTWRGKIATEGGGVLINQALHTLDLLEYFLGEPQYVTAKTENFTLQNQIEVEDTATAIFSGQSNFVFFATNGSAQEYPIQITLRTEQEYIQVYPHEVFIDGVCQYSDNINQVLGKRDYGIGHKPLIRDFYSCLQTGRHFSIDGEEGSKVLKLIFTAYRSNGKKIQI